jgi:glycosyltransferase involved in cell wall biosynthesis
MRILFFGNQGNTGYRFGRWLREAGYEVKLLIPDNLKYERSYPEWEDPALKDQYPEWIQIYRENRYPYLFLNAFVRKTARDYDLVMVTGFHILPLLKLDKPLVFLPVGADLSQMPFWTGRWVEELEAWLYRRRIGKLSLILTEQEDCIWAARLLGVGDKVRRFPFLIDLNQINHSVNNELALQLSEKYQAYDRIFFNPSRKNLDPARRDYKGAEKLLRAFKRYIEDYQSSRVLMISGLHGLHKEEYRNMVTEMKLDSHIEYTGQLALPDLYAYYSLDNVVVFDQFTENLNTLGGIQREAMAMGCPVVSSTDVYTRQFIAGYGPGCPLIPAFDEEEILNAMKKLTRLEQEEMDQYRESVKNWALRYLHYENRMSRFTGLLEEAMNSYNH